MKIEKGMEARERREHYENVEWVAKGNLNLETYTKSS